MKSHVPALEGFLRNTFSLVNLGAWEPKTDTVFVDMNAIEEYSLKTGFASEDLRVFTLKHELLNRFLQTTIPLTSLMLINRENIGFILDLDHHLKTQGERAIKLILILNSIIMKRLFNETEPLIEAYYMSKMAKGKKDSIFESLKDELLMAYPTARHIFQRIQNIGNDMVIIDALNNPRLCHECIMLYDLSQIRLPREELAGMWPELERPYERCMSMIDAIEVTRKKRNNPNPHLSEKEKIEELPMAKRLARIKSGWVDLSQLPAAIKPVISTKLYLKPKATRESKLKDLLYSFQLELKGNQVSFGIPIKRPRYETSFVNLNLTWILQQAFAKSSEISCFFETFNACKSNCSSCTCRKDIANGIRLSEIFRTVETRKMEYLQKVFDSPPEDF